MMCWYLRWWWKIKCIPKWQVNKDYISCEDCILFCPSWLNIFHLAPCGPVEDWRGIENENLWSLLIVKWNWVGRIFLLLHKASGRHQARDNHYHSQKVETLGKRFETNTAYLVVIIYCSENNPYLVIKQWNSNRICICIGCSFYTFVFCCDVAMLGVEALIHWEQIKHLQDRSKVVYYQPI